MLSMLYAFSMAIIACYGIHNTWKLGKWWLLLTLFNSLMLLGALDYIFRPELAELGVSPLDLIWVFLNWAAFFRLRKKNIKKTEVSVAWAKTLKSFHLEALFLYLLIFFFILERYFIFFYILDMKKIFCFVVMWFLLLSCGSASDRETPLDQSGSSQETLREPTQVLEWEFEVQAAGKDEDTSQIEEDFSKDLQWLLDMVDGGSDE